MARIVEFEGRRIEVPDDASDDEVAGIISSAPAASAATASAPAAGTAAPQSMTDTIMSGASTAGRYVDRGVRGLARGLMNVAGSPSDVGAMAHSAGNWLGEQLGLPDGGRRFVANMMPLAPLRVLPGSDTLKGGLDTLNDKTADLLEVQRPYTEPRKLSDLITGAEPKRIKPSLGEHIVERTGEELGAAMVPIGGAIAAGGRMGVEAARKLPLLARMFVEPAAINAPRFAAKEGGTALAAGLGAGTTTGLLGTKDGTLGNAAADVGGALGGAGLLGAARMATGPAADLLKLIIPSQRDKFSNQLVKDEVVDIISNAATSLPKSPGEPINTEQLVNTISRGPRVADVIPNFKETVADRTKDPGLAALEYSRQSGPNSGTFAASRAKNAQAVDQAMQSNAPTEAPGAFSAELELERGRRIDNARTIHASADDEAERLTTPLTPQGTPAQRGNTIRTGLEDSREAARQRTEAAYDNADVNNVPADPVHLRETIDNATANMTEAERNLLPEGLVERVRRLGEPNPDVDTGVLDAAGNPITRPGAPPDQIRLKEATDLRSELQRLERAAAADPKAEKGGRNAARVYSNLRAGVDRYIRETLPPDQQEALIAARGTKLEEADSFTRQGDPVADVLARREGGIPKVRDDRVAGTFVNDQAMGRLLQEADTPDVRRAIRDEVLSRGDMGDAARIREFTQTYGPQIDRFPGLRQELDAAATAREGAATAGENSERLFRELGSPNSRGTSPVAKYLEFGDERASDAMHGVINAKDPSRAIDELLTTVNDDPKAVEGAKRAFWNLMEGKTRSSGGTTATPDGVQPWRAGALKKFMDDPKVAAVAQRLYRDNPQHLENVKKISDALQGVDLRLGAKAPASSGTAQGVSSVLTPETVQSRFYAYKRGQISLGFMVTALASVVARRATRSAQKEGISRLLDQALVDPDLAATLLKENNPANRAALRRTSKAYLGNETATIIDALGGDDSEDKKEDPVKKAITR